MSRVLLDSRGEQRLDDWQPLADDAPIPAAGRVLVSLDRWLADAALRRHAADRSAVWIANTVDARELAEALADAALLVLQFPTFADGRAYSQARLLATRLRPARALRASGAAVVRDQLAFLRQCGFTEFLLRADQDAAACAAVLRQADARPDPERDIAAPVPIAAAA